MPVIVLGNDGADLPVVAPGRVQVDLVELVAIARDGGHRLPFDDSAVDGLSAQQGSAERRAWFSRLSPDGAAPEDEIAVLLAEQTEQLGTTAADPERAALRTLVGEALGVLANAETLLQVELGLRLGVGQPDQAKAWVGVHGEVAVSLGTVTGAAFEVAWGATSALPEMLAHLVRLPDGAAETDADEWFEIPGRFTMPVELLAADGVSAVRHRDDLLPGLVERFPGAVTRGDGEVCSAAEAAQLLHAVRDRLTARLRVLLPDGDAQRAGVVVWMRLGTQWFALDTAMVAGFPVASATAVEPGDLAAAVGPVLARVWGRR